VKATNKSTNPTPDPAKKLNQAINKRKLAEERPRQGTLASSYPPLEVIPLNKLEEEEKSEEQHVKLMTLKEHLLGGNPTLGNILFLCFVHFLCLLCLNFK